MFELQHYLDSGQRSPYLEWLRRLPDRRASIAIERRLNRVELGNFGDHRACRDGVWELRIDVGPGYRVYYALLGPHSVLLLGGGDKRSQRADLDKAYANWQDWQRRMKWTPPT